MKRNRSVFFPLVFALAVLAGCSSKPAAESQKAAPAPDKIQGKAQVLEENLGAGDAALNAGGPSVYIWQGMRRYRLFLRNPAQVVHGKEYTVEGIDAKKVIDDLGDPDQGKNGYPLSASCERAVKTAWPKLAFDDLGATAEALRGRLKRYPGRAVFLVTKIDPVPDEAAKKDTDDAKNAPEVSVPAEKQKALLAEGTTVQPAPLWEPAGATVSCKVTIGPDGKVTELGSGAQLCEAFDWSKLRYQPTVQGGKPAKVKTEVELKYEPKK